MEKTTKAGALTTLDDARAQVEEVVSDFLDFNNELGQVKDTVLAKHLVKLYTHVGRMAVNVVTLADLAECRYMKKESGK